MVDESVKSVVRRYLTELKRLGVPVSFGFVYGSQATGTARPDSDIDLVVVSPVFDGPYTHSESNCLWTATAHTDARIEPVPCGEKEWTSGNAGIFGFVEKNRGEQVAV